MTPTDVVIIERPRQVVITEKPPKAAVVQVEKPAPGATTGQEIIGEVPSGAVNGSNATFTTQFSFLPESVRVFVNGQRQNIPDDYVTQGQFTITLMFSPAVGETIQVDYRRA